MSYVLPPPANCNHKPQETGALADLPLGFDPDQYPILGRHWFGWRSVSELVADAVADIQIDRRIEVQESGS